MNGRTHLTPRLRRDVVREIYEDVVAMANQGGVNSEHLDWALKESARRDSMASAKGAQKQIRDALSTYAVQQDVRLDDISMGLERLLVHELLRGREVDLQMWIEIDREVDAEFGDAKGEITRYEGRVVRTDANGRETVAELSIQF